MEITQIDATGLTVKIAPELCERLAEACAWAQRGNSLETAGTVWEPLKAQLFAALAGQFATARLAAQRLGED